MIAKAPTNMNKYEKLPTYTKIKRTKDELHTIVIFLKDWNDKALRNSDRNLNAIL